MKSSFTANIRTSLHLTAALTLVVFLGLSLTGCRTTAPSPSPMATLNNEGGGQESRLRNGDQIQVRLDTGTLSPGPVEVVIDEDGEISLPLVGHVKAAGSTASELSERIQAAYVPRYYVHCNATVLATVRFFYVGGEIRAPGRYNWSEDITLLKAINTAGGFTEYSNRRKVEVARDKGKQVFDAEEIRQHPAKDVPLRPGDSINILRGMF
jgi:polysaccharide export outer membrane protein